jgi:hypothetical protein
LQSVAQIHRLHLERFAAGVGTPHVTATTRLRHRGLVR